MRYKYLCLLLVLALGLATTLLASQGDEFDEFGEEPRVELPLELGIDSDAYARKGAECPTGSGSYCSDKVPVCCLIKGEYLCHKSLADCKE